MTKVTLAKINTKAALKFNNKTVKIDGYIIGILGKPALGSSDLVFFAQSPEAANFNDKNFGTEQQAISFFSSCGI